MGWEDRAVEGVSKSEGEESEACNWLLQFEDGRLAKTTSVQDAVAVARENGWPGPTGKTHLQKAEEIVAAFRRSLGEVDLEPDEWKAIEKVLGARIRVPDWARERILSYVIESENREKELELRAICAEKALDELRFSASVFSDSIRGIFISDQVIAARAGKRVTWEPLLAHVKKLRLQSAEDARREILLKALLNLQRTFGMSPLKVIQKMLDEHPGVD